MLGEDVVAPSCGVRQSTGGAVNLEDPSDAPPPSGTPGIVTVDQINTRRKLYAVAYLTVCNKRTNCQRCKAVVYRSINKVVLALI